MEPCYYENPWMHFFYKYQLTRVLVQAMMGQQRQSVMMGLIHVAKNTLDHPVPSCNSSWSWAPSAPACLFMGIQIKVGGLMAKVGSLP